MIRFLSQISGEAPKRATSLSAGFDLICIEPVFIEPGGRQLVRTGVQVEIPPGYAGLICPRSGLAKRRGVTVLNAPGVIDADYRGEIGVLLVNHGDQDWGAPPGARIAQLVVIPVMLQAGTVTELGETIRDDGGWGSTGA